MSKRILITGSRHWTDRAAIKEALIEAIKFHQLGVDDILVHGACEYGGADIIAAEIWESWGCQTEAWPAMKIAGRIYGPERNQKMVDLGADVCLAFPMKGSRGTWDCVRRAREAGIPVIIVNG